MLKLTQSCITFRTTEYNLVSLKCYMPSGNFWIYVSVVQLREFANLKWTPSYVAAFVEVFFTTWRIRCGEQSTFMFKQWHRGSRVIDHVQSTLRWTTHFPNHFLFGSQIFEALGQLEQPPQVCIQQLHMLHVFFLLYRLSLWTHWTATWEIDCRRSEAKRSTSTSVRLFAFHLCCYV